jgi:opacity protein-like surface antigen
MIQTSAKEDVVKFHSSLKRLIVSISLAALTCLSAHAQTDVALSVYGAFSGTTNNNNIQESPANAAGGMVELRHIHNPLVGYEATYSFNRANQKYTGPVPFCPVGPGPCLTPTASVSADAHEITADWVVSVHAGSFRPFALAGAGVLINQPAGNQNGTQSATTGVYVYGGGLDWGLLPHIGLRFQYRGNVYKAPELTNAFGSINAFKHTAEPMIGAYFRF